MENGADICLVVEGSYPYVTGGVSSWLQWLMKSMPDFTFSVVALISEAKTPEERQYPLPGNVLEYKEFVISDFTEIQNAPYSKMSRREWHRIYRRLYRLMIDWQKGYFSVESLTLVKELIEKAPGIFRNFFEDEMGFALLTEIYEKKARFKLTEKSFEHLRREEISKPLLKKLNDLQEQEYLTEDTFLYALEDTIGERQTAQYRDLMLKHVEKFDKRGDKGFLKYFYNFRNIHFGIFRAISLVSRLPAARLYHAPGTGYSGLVTCLRALVYGGIPIITTHGSYVEEREIDIRKFKWVEDRYLRNMWLDFFRAICRWEYNYCKRLITISEEIKGLMVLYGAHEKKVEVIPNAVNVERFKPARKMRCTSNPRIVGFVGRVDSIKDLKTFIQAMAIVKKNYEDFQAWIIGPYDERPGYYKECVDLVTVLGLQEMITFTGRVNVLEYYQKMDVLLLTSIKEGMPLAAMEAMACGVPVVATDVGACEELLYGRADDDLGKAGLLTRIMDPKGIATATLKILNDKTLANTFGQTGIKRIEKYYTEELIISQYRKVYREELNGEG